MKENESFSREVAQAEAAELLKGDNWDLPTDIRLLEAIDAEIERRLIAAGFGEDEATDLMLGVHEAIINAMVHGNLELNSAAEALKVQPRPDKRVKVKLEISPGSARFEVEDEGPGFDWHQSKQASTEDDSGRGIKIYVEPYFDVDYNDKGNQITLTNKKTA